MSLVNPISLVVDVTENLDATLRAGIVQLCIAAHNEPSFENLFVWVPAGGLHVLAVLNGKLVGHAMATTRWLQPEGMHVMRTAYVDAVSTSPAHQRQGIGSVVMRQLVAQLTDYEVACLETDKPAFYERLGWQQWRGPKAGRDGEQLIPTLDEQIVMIHTLNKLVKLNLYGLLTIECQPGRIW
jgi:predicted N-acetyltransferase YhbS